MPERPGPGPEFLKKKYDLHNTPEVASAVKRTEIRTGEKAPQDPTVRIQNYLDRLERLVLDTEKTQRRKKLKGGRDDAERPRAMTLLREMVMNKYVRPQKEKMAQAATRVEERAAGELGINMRYTEEQREQRGDIAVEDVEGSLDQWINYLSDPNEPYPTWFRYYAFRNILDLGEYDKDKGAFPERSAGTIRLFPDIDRGALAHMQDLIEADKDSTVFDRLRHAQMETQTPADQLLTKEKVKAFANLSFAKQYAESMKEAGEITPELRAETRGSWVTYPKDSDPAPLWKSLQNKGAAWCTKGYGTAANQLKDGDFHVYYTLDKQGNPTIPRIAVRMVAEKVFEARGVADTKQNLEANMADIAEQKLNQLPGAEKYRKASADMKQLTDIGNKTEKETALTKAELTFLYEIDGSIEGFGYGQDPRIKEIQAKRNTKEDAPIVLDVAPEEIAWSKSEIDPILTRAYIGPLFPGVFEIKNLEHLYTTFPAREITTTTLEVGGKTPKQYATELTKAGFKIYDYAQQMLDRAEKEKLFVAKRSEKDIVRLTVADLGFSNGATNQQIWDRGIELGLDLCPPEVGPELRLSMKDQPQGDYVVVMMKPIAVAGGGLDAFGVYARGGDRWLFDDDGHPGRRRDTDDAVAFLRRKH